MRENEKLRPMSRAGCIVIDKGIFGDGDRRFRPKSEIGFWRISASSHLPDWDGECDERSGLETSLPLP